MTTHITYRLILALVAAAIAVPALAGPATPPARAGLQELSDADLGAMRGRYIVGDNRVAWFGVTMVSDWATASGQHLQGAMTLGFDLGGARPTVSFQPSVTITAGEAPAVAGTGQVDAAGLANVGGLVQAVQVAGDGNTARNGLSLRVRDGAVALPATQGARSAEHQVGSAQARASLDDGGARVLLQVAGQGAVTQWIDARAIGQSIQLTGDGSRVGNQMQLDLVRQAVPASQAVHQNLIQAIGMTRAGGL